MRWLRLFAVSVCCWTFATAAWAQSACSAPDAVCKASASVLMISSFEPIGSAVIVGESLLVTNRHMIADNAEATVTLTDGKTVTGRVIPTDYPGDLVLLEVPGIGHVGSLSPGVADMQSTLYAIGYDVGREAIRVYAPGRLIVPKAETPLARLHHDARSLPGNSGGALVDASGHIVGIIASGGEGRNEAIPVTEINRLMEMSGPTKIAASTVIGLAYRQCVEGLDALRAATVAPPAGDVGVLKTACLASGNRQLIDLAAQALGTRRDVEGALQLLEESYAQDRNAPNTLISLAVTFHLAGRYEDEIPIVRRGLEFLPDDPQLLRLALQAGIWGGDKALASDAMRRIETVIPQMAPAARRFFDLAPPPPKIGPRK